MHGTNQSTVQPHLELQGPVAGLARKLLSPCPSIPVGFADNHRQLLPAFNHVTSVRHSDNPIKVTRCARAHTTQGIRIAWDSKFHRNRSSLITPTYTTARVCIADYRHTMYLSSYTPEPGFGRRSKEITYISSDQHLRYHMLNFDVVASA